MSKAEYDIKHDAILDAQEDDYYQKATNEQLEFMLKLVDRIEHEKIHRIGLFLKLKEDELRKEKENKNLSQISNTPPLTSLPPLKGNIPVVQNQ